MIQLSRGLVFLVGGGGGLELRILAQSDGFNQLPGVGFN